MEPFSRQVLSLAKYKLRRFANQHFVRLPRLVASMRSLRANTCQDAAADALSLANELFALKGESSESDLLHSAAIAQTKHPADYIIGFRLNFSTLSAFEAAVFYWQTRILLYRLRSRLQQMFPDLAVFNQQSMTAESARMATNLLMSWESAFDHGFSGRFAAALERSLS